MCSYDGQVLALRMRRGLSTAVHRPGSEEILIGGCSLRIVLRPLVSAENSTYTGARGDK